MIYLTQRSFLTSLIILLWGAFLLSGKKGWAKITKAEVLNPVVTITGVDVPVSTVEPGTFDHILYQFQIDVVDSIAVFETLSLTFGGTYNLFDVLGFSIISGTSPDIFSASSFISVSPAPAGTSLTFNIQQNLSPGQTWYFWVTADLSPGASSGNTIQALAPDLNAFLFNASADVTGTNLADGGIQTFGLAGPSLTFDFPNIDPAIPFFSFSFITTPTLPSFVQSYTVQGDSLEGDVRLCFQDPFSEGPATLSCGFFELSTQEDGPFVDSLTLPVSNGQIINQPVTIYVRLKDSLEVLETIEIPFIPEGPVIGVGGYECDILHETPNLNPFSIDFVPLNGSVIGVDSVKSDCGLRSNLSGVLPSEGDIVSGWELINGPDDQVRFDNALSHETPVSVVVPGTYTFRWTVSTPISGPEIAASIDSSNVIEVTFESPRADLGPDLASDSLSLRLASNLESGTTATLHAVLQPDSSTFDFSFSADSSEVMIAVDKPGTYIFLWEVSTSSGCRQQDSLKVAFQSTPVDDLIAPNNFQLFVSGPHTVQLSWVAENSAATSYKIFRKAASEINFTEIASIGADVNTFEDNIPVPGQLYFYRVQAINERICDQVCQASCNTCSQILGAVTEVPTALEDPILKNSTRTYPNPSKRIFIVNMENNYQGSLFFKIFDAEGRLIFEKSLLKNDKSFSFPIDLQDREAGIYLLHIQSEVGYITKRLLKE